MNTRIPAVETHDLTKRFGKGALQKTAVDHLNLTIYEGELFSLLGVNGAGKTTTIRMLSCLSVPSEGDALLLGDSILSQSAAVKAKINVSPQETAVAKKLTVRENLELIAQLYGCSRAKAKSRADDLLTSLDLTEVSRSRVSTLSGGMQRRLSIAMALITRPRILFLDEPTLGLDVLARRELWALIESLKGKITIVLTTHYMEEAQSLSDRIGIMADGQLKASGTLQELLSQTNAASLEDAFIALASTCSKEVLA